MTQSPFQSLKHCCRRYAFITVPNELKSNESGLFFEIQDCPYCGRRLRLQFKKAVPEMNMCVSENAEYFYENTLSHLTQRP